MQRESATATFIGAGPVSLAALIVYLDSTVETPRNVKLIYPSEEATSYPLTPKNTDTGDFKIGTTGEAAKRFSQYSAYGSMSKSNKDVLLKEVNQISQSYFWGASCFPQPSDLELESEIDLGFQKDIAKRWKIQAEDDALSTLYPLAGETIGKLMRKRISHNFVKKNMANKEMLVGHSRLAISTSDEGQCKYCGQCFVSCPQNSPWTPNFDLNYIREKHSDVVILHETVMNLQQKGSSYIITTDTTEILTQELFLGAGWKNSLKLIGKLLEKDLDPLFNLKQSNVIIKPILLFHPASFDDFHNSFVYSDCVTVLPSQNGKRIESFTQIYFPTLDLWMRVLSNSPKRIHTLLLKLLCRFSWITNIGRYFGVAMIFFEGSTWSLDVPKMNKVKKATIKKLNKSLSAISGSLIPGVEKKMQPGSSQHVGILHPKIAEEIRLNHPNLHITSPLNLAKLPPGPHTFSSAIIASHEAYLSCVRKRECQ